MDVLDRAIGRLNAWWRTFLAPAPDPRQPLVDAVGRQRALLRRVRQARGDLAAARRQLQSRILPMLGVLRTLEDRARQALTAEREDVARLALERRWSLAQELRALEEQAQELGREEEQLGLVEERLATRTEAFDARQQALAARTSAADAQARIAEELALLSTEVGDVSPALDEAERKAERSQARAAAIERLVEAGSLETLGLGGGDLLQREIAALDRTRTIEEQLAMLRRQTRPDDIP